jgi:hypothetical protein
MKNWIKDIPEFSKKDMEDFESEFRKLDFNPEGATVSFSGHYDGNLELKDAGECKFYLDDRCGYRGNVKMKAVSHEKKCTDPIGTITFSGNLINDFEYFEDKIDLNEDLYIAKWCDFKLEYLLIPSVSNVSDFRYLWE